MAQHDYDIANASGASVRADLNLVFAAIASNNSGATAPPTTFANQWWFDTANNLLKQRNEANAAWIVVAEKTATDWKSYHGTVALEAAVMAWTANHDFGAQVLWTGVISPAQITSNQNNYNPTSLSGALQLRVNTDASRNVTGLSGGADGRLILVTNIGSFDIVLTDQDGSSSAANRFLFAGGDRTLTPDESVLLKYDGTDSRWRAAQDRIASGITRYTAIATTSGTAHDFTGIPSGTNRITVMLDEVSLSGSDDPLIQLGDAGGIESAGYASGSDASASSTTSTAGYVTGVNFGAADLISGILVLMRIDGNAWIGFAEMQLDGSGVIRSAVGRKTLSAELTQLRLTVTGANSFDAGQVNITTEI